MFRDSSAVVPSLVLDGRAPKLGALLPADREVMRWSARSVDRLREAARHEGFAVASA